MLFNAGRAKARFLSAEVSVAEKINFLSKSIIPNHTEIAHRAGCSPVMQLHALVMHNKSGQNIIVKFGTDRWEENMVSTSIGVAMLSPAFHCQQLQ